VSSTRSRPDRQRAVRPRLRSPRGSVGRAADRPRTREDAREEDPGDREARRRVGRCPSVAPSRGGRCKDRGCKRPRAPLDRLTPSSRVAVQAFALSARRPRPDPGLPPRPRRASEQFPARRERVFGRRGVTPRPQDPMPLRAHPHPPIPGTTVCRSRSASGSSRSPLSSRALIRSRHSGVISGSR
jgi:hypothetical protein